MKKLLSCTLAVLLCASTAQAVEYAQFNENGVVEIRSDNYITQGVVDANRALVLTDDQYAQFLNGAITLSNTMPLAIVAVVKQIPVPQADPQGFAQAIKTGLGGILAANAIMTLYPAFFPAIQASQWEDVAIIIQDAKSKSFISADKYVLFQQAATQFNIPVILP